MENTQALGLFCGLVLYAWHGAREKSLGRRKLLLSLSLIYLTLLVLEVDVRKWGVLWLNKALNGRLRDLWLGLLWMTNSILILRDIRAFWHSGLAWLRSPSGVLVILAGVLWVISGLVDKLRLYPDAHHFPEELIETNACLLMLLAAAWLRRT